MASLASVAGMELLGRAKREMDGSWAFTESRVGCAFLVVVLHSMEKGISDWKAGEGGGVSQCQ